MSGHSKWSTIKRQKGAADAKRGQLFSELAKLISVAAKHGGGDPSMNPRLRIVVEQARAANMPKDNVERAIGRGTGEIGAEQLEEVRFEVYGPAGVGILVDAVTDNSNRTTAEIKAVLNKLGAKLATPGAVSYQFVQRAVLMLPSANQPIDQDALELAVIDAGADNYETVPEGLIVYTDPKNLSQVKTSLESQGVLITESKLSWEPTQLTPVTDPETARKILRLMETLEDLEDVTSVTANFDIPDDVLI